jgi:DnaJ-class molecular chaperone
MYHPDKNKSEDAPMKFLEVKDAYEYLEKRWNKEEI